MTLVSPVALPDATVRRSATPGGAGSKSLLSEQGGVHVTPAMTAQMTVEMTRFIFVSGGLPGAAPQYIGLRFIGDRPVLHSYMTIYDNNVIFVQSAHPQDAGLSRADWPDPSYRLAFSHAAFS